MLEEADLFSKNLQRNARIQMNMAGRHTWHALAIAVVMVFGCRSISGFWKNE
jgi:hypothetical protein